MGGEADGHAWESRGEDWSGTERALKNWDCKIRVCFKHNRSWIPHLYAGCYHLESIGNWNERCTTELELLSYFAFHFRNVFVF